MQRRMLNALTAHAVREIRNRSSLAQQPAAFRALYCQQSASASSSATDSSAAQAGQAATSQRPPETDANTGQPEERFGLVFTCNVCDKRSMRSFSKRAYNHGVVIIKCPECQNRHLIADRLGWFENAGGLEEIMADKGQEVRWHDAGTTLELTDQDVAAWAEAVQDSKAGIPDEEGENAGHVAA